MSKADKIFLSNLHDIMENGYSDEGMPVRTGRTVRPRIPLKSSVS